MRIPSFLLLQDLLYNPFRTSSTLKTLFSPLRAMSVIPALARNFPDSTASPSSIFQWPGVSNESTKVVRRVLEENDRKHDIYEKARFAHNHFPHSVLTRYSLGAPPKLLEDNWKHDEPHLVSLDPGAGDRKTGDLSRLPAAVTRENWDDPQTLGFKDAYSRYIAFFHAEIDRLGPLGTIEEYVFSPQANWETREDRPPPQMLVRMVAGVLHPFIHAGFGIEFQDRVVLAEGLAEAAVHDNSILTRLYPDNWPQAAYPNPDNTTSQVKLDSWGKPDLTNSKQPGLTLLEVFAAFMADTQLVPAKYDPDMMINDRLIAATEDGRSEKLVDLASKWVLSDDAVGDGPVGYQRRLEEIAILTTLIACSTGRTGQAPRIDFFLMHALTSSIFLHSYLPVLGVPQRRALLQTYLLTVLVTTIARGKPKIDLEYLMSASAYPLAPGSTPDKESVGEVMSDPSDPLTRSAWGGLVESSLYAQDSHTPKSIRPLLLYSTLYGNTPKGGFIGARSDLVQSSLPGIEILDGSIFVRGAGLVMEVMGWCREGEKEGAWGTSPIGYDEVWK